MKKVLLVNVLNNFLTTIDDEKYNDYYFDILTFTKEAYKSNNNRMDILNLNCNDVGYYNVTNKHEHYIFINSLYRDYIYFMLRTSQDIQEINFKFYQAVNFWFQYYSNNKVDFVIGMTAFHGGPSDLALDIGIYFNVPVFEKILTTPEYFGLFYRNSSLYVKNTINIKPLDFYDSYNYPLIWDLILDTKKTDGLKNYKNAIPKIIVKILGIQRSRSYYHKYKYLLKNDNASGMKHLRLKSSMEYRKLTKEMYSKSLDDFNPESNFVYFSLNLEPEASTNGKWTISSQIYWIKLISKYLPEGIDLVVKDHPYLLNMDSKHTFYLFENSQFYRGPYFYSQLKSINNVRLINHTISSKTLIHKSILNICMNGTIVTESVMANRPIIILEHRFSFGKMFNNAIFFDEVKDLIEFISKLKVENVYPQNFSNHKEIIQKYSFRLEDIGSPYSFDATLASILNFLDNDISK